MNWVGFVDENKDFVRQVYGTRAAWERLVAFMSDHAGAKAEEKIGLAAKIDSIAHEQFSFEIWSEQ